MLKHTTAMVMTLALAACSEGYEPEAALDGDLEVRADEIVDNLLEAGFLASDIEVDEDGVVIVGGDAVVDLEASREMIGEHGHEEGEDAFRQYRTLNLVSPSIDVVCVDGSAFTGTLSTGLDNAIKNFNSLNLHFNMVRTPAANAGCDVTIVGSVVAGTGGLAGFPSSGLPYTSIQIGSGIADYGTAAVTHVITHELGHCIGFRHSDFYDRSISCSGTAVNEGPSAYGAIHISGTPTDAVFNGSVMNSCYNAGSQGVFSITDFTAINELYATGPSLRGVHRKLNAASGEHFYTTSIHESTYGLESSNYFYLEEDAGAGLVPFQRCLKGNGLHFYTQSATCEGQTVEGPMGYIRTGAGTAGTTALYRLYNGNDHLFTTSLAERNAALTIGYIYEGVAGYVWAP